MDPPASAPTEVANIHTKDHIDAQENKPVQLPLPHKYLSSIKSSNNN
jgi:hypothetical protein